MPDFWINCLLLLINMSLGLIYYKNLQPGYIRKIVVFVVVSFFVEVIAYIYSDYTKRSNHFIFNIFFLIQISILLYIFFRTFESKKQKTFAITLLSIYLGVSLFNIIAGQGFYQLNSNTYGFGSVCIIFCSIYYLAKLFLSDTPVNFFTIPMFWITTGLLFYFTGNFVYLSLLGYIVKYNLDPRGDVFAIIMTALNFILHTMVFVGIYTASKWNQKKSYLQ